MNVKGMFICLFSVIPLLLSFGCEQPQEAQGPGATQKSYKIAILVASDMYVSSSAEGLKEGMRGLGYKEGETIEYTVYNAEGDGSRLNSLAEQAVAAKPDVICPAIITAIDAVKATSTKKPVIFLESMYPVEFGLVESLTRPGGNYTGVSNMTGPMSGKRLELLAKIDPRIKRVALFYNPVNKVAEMSLDTTKVAATALGLQLDIHSVHSPTDLDAAIDKVRSSPVDALVLNPDFMVFSRLVEIAAMARAKKIPTMGIDPSQVEQGILASYGGGLKEIARQAARQVDRVLRGESPANIPIEAPRKYRLVINLKTAEEIGLEVPKEILYQAEGYYR